MTVNEPDMICKEYRVTASTFTASASALYSEGPLQNIPHKTDIFYWLLIMKLKNFIISSARASGKGNPILTLTTDKQIYTYLCVCVCMYRCVCIYIYIYTYTHTYTHTHTSSEF